jgi:hypothetical protein
MQTERRRHARVSVDIDVEVSVQISKKLKGRVTDMSEAGLFVTPGDNIEKGNFVVVRFTGHNMMFGAVVRRVVENGFGAEFGSMSIAHRDILLKFIPRPDLAKVSLAAQMPAIMLMCDEGANPILESELQKAGFSVLSVRSLDKALPSMERFDVVGVISDYLVGNKDTLSILSRIAEQEKARKSPVFLYSGRHDAPYRKFEESGVRCFSKSTVTPKNLVAHLKKAFLKKR